MREVVIDLEIDQETGDYVAKREKQQEQQEPRRKKRRVKRPPPATVHLHQLLDGVEAGCDLIERATGIFNKYAGKRDA